jgi:hypothetical protein
MNGRAWIVVDSAFSSMGHPSLIASYQNLNNRHRNRALNNEAKAVRQMSEWGKQGFQSSFPHLKEQIRYEARGERKITLTLVTLLYNYRVANVGQKQIRSVYMPYLDRNVEQIIPNIKVYMFIVNCYTIHFEMSCFITFN